jgi:hypothetical protein
MAWKKIDDAQALPDMPYSSFLANGLTTNANSYNEDLRRGGGIAWNAHDPVTWSSYWEPQGVMFTVNVGQAVTEIEFRITYATLTGSKDTNDVQGIVFLQNMTSGELVRVGVPPTSGSLSYLDITLPSNATVSGPQAFSLCFQSSQLEDLGIVKVRGGQGNIVFLDDYGGPSAYNITQGEKHEILDLTNVDAPSAGETDTQNLYQINYISTGAPNPPDGNASVYPPLVSNPPRLNPYYDSAKNADGRVYELGAMTLLGIAFNSTVANVGTAPPQFSHNTAAPLSTLIGIQNTSLTQFRPDLCNGVSQRFSFGAVLGSTGIFPGHSADAQGTSFSFITNAAVTNCELSVTFRYYGLRRAGSNSRMLLEVVDESGVFVAGLELPIDVYTTTEPLSVIGVTARDWYEPDAVAAWGMRDSMTPLEMTFGDRFTFNVPLPTLPINKVYTVTIVPRFITGIYVYNMYARLIPPVGNAG